MQSTVHQTEVLLFFTLLQLSVIVVVARLAGEIAVRLSQSRAVGEIVAGLMLGPSLFGLLLPGLFKYVFRSAAAEPMTILSQIGLILLMFQIGLEFEFGHLKTGQNRKAVVNVSIMGLALPFALGVLLHDQPAFVRAWREKVGDFVVVFLLPIFFTYTGLRTNIGALNSAEVWGWCVLLVLLASAGKFGGCYFAARRSGMNPQEAKAIGIMMNTRALMELVVINVGLDLGVIPPDVFTMLVLMAIASTVVTTPALKIWLKPDKRASLQGVSQP